jgi:N-acetylglucosaminyldiphosphoundecaprenol N-acetyl-beta-D-mannosaminyltransferase
MHARTPTPAANVSPPERVNVLGVGVSAINMADALAHTARAIEQHRKGYVCVTGVHGVSEAQSDPAFREILNRAFLCTPDGMPLVWVGRCQGARDMDRVYGPDLMLAIMESSEKMGWRHFFYGGANGTAEALKAKLSERFPNIQIVGTYEPPFRPLHPEEIKQLQDQVRLARPDIMWIGLSTPKQERFMAQHLEKFDVTLMFGVGAAFDFHAGRVPQAPRWMQRSGLEWFYRLCREPRRLWKRYLKNNPLFVARILCQLTRLKKFPLDRRN